MFASSQLWQENLQQSPKAVFYYEWVSPHAAVLIDTGPSNFDVQNMVVVAERERWGPHYRSVFPTSLHTSLVQSNQGCREGSSVLQGG